MYTILSTFPPHASGNVGDKLLEEQTQSLIKKETGKDDFNIAFRSRDFSSTIDDLNKSDAIILPAFAIREPIHPNTYALVENLNDIDVPIIPLAANWSHYPGGRIGNSTYTYHPETVSFIQNLNKQDSLEKLTTRDIYTKKILERHGFNNVTLVGDLAWYHEDYMGESMRVPETIDHVVMTTPHNSHYFDQAEALMDMLVDEFPNATLTCSFHSSLSDSDKKLRTSAEEHGFEIVLASHDTDNIAFYDECDLHVGYRLHGHLSFLRRRLPSVLIGEDGRGNGFNATLGVGGFQATERRIGPRAASTVRRISASVLGKGVRSILQTKFNSPNPFRQAIAPQDMTVPNKIRRFLQQEMQNDFSSYSTVPELFDSTYEKSMKPFLNSLP
ncbi:polysaccharide pyruvyl transferase family protein [Natronorubrum sp. FCH18a]|uniref:polysaccharide pyruvyl transferase family protein n=1 Tax=Natronorubrum sp. FCH18a TaxID=3447018 RepID=UPI003F514308